MRIDRLELVNFRGFERLELELHPRLTLLVGVNGSGKSNALEGLAVALSPWITLLHDMASEGRYVVHDDIRLLVVEHGGVATLEPHFPLEVNAVASVGSERLAWSQTLGSFGQAHQVDVWERANGRPILVLGGDVVQVVDAVKRRRTAMDEGRPVELPVIAYYHTNRLWDGGEGDGSPADEPRLGSRLRGYRAALNSKASTASFKSWMAWRTEVWLQRLATLIVAGQSADVPPAPELEAIERVVLGCVDGAKRFYYDINHHALRLELADGQIIPFSQLSDGYRNLVAMVADITWRALQLNPHYGADAARKATGVVLIDELELHLHPAWQRRVIDSLLTTFPSLQLVATTHSPQIIASARPEHMWLLHEGRAHRPGPIHGKDSNGILRDLMGVDERPGWMQERLDRLARLIEDDALSEAKALLAEIEADLGQDDPAVLGLQWELHDLEVHGAKDSEAEGA